MTEQPFQVMPPLDDDQRHALRQSIQESGVLQPIEVDENGAILDGHHRAAIAAELGIDYPTRVVAGLTDDAEKRRYATTINVVRRQLNPSVRSGYVAQLRAQGMSIRQIAKETGVSVGTVHADLKVFNSEHLPASVTGADGKTYAATRPAPAPTAPTCEACGEKLPDEQAKVGYLRCDECDPNGVHTATTFPERGGPCEACTQSPATPPEPAPAASTSTGAGPHTPARRDPDPAGPGVATTGGPVNPTPTTQLPADVDARLDAELDAAMADTVTRFRANFSTARVRAGELTTFHPDRVCEVYASNWEREVGDLLDLLDQWTRQVRETYRSRQRAGLRLVSGGDR